MEDSKVFSVRIVSIDYYMTPPISGVDISYSTFHGGKVKEVPVIRIFGSTPAGQKTCLHIHRALPYLYIPFSDLGHVPNDEVDSCIHAISLGLEKTLKLKGNAGSNRQHVHGCSLVQARKFYGYHSKEELFVKIYFYYPQDVSRAANRLLAGAIMDKVLQPHESHIPFLLQFLIDYNLYGMGHIHVSKIKFRHPWPDVFSPRKSKRNGELNSLADDSTCVPMNSQAGIGNDVCLNLPIWTSSTISYDQILQYSCHPDSSTNEDIPLCRRQSTSELEGDAIVDEIINQQFLSYEPLSQTNSEVKMVHSLVPIWEEEFERSGVPEAMPPDFGKPLPQDVLRTLSEGIDFGKFMEVTNDKESESSFTPSIKCSTDCRNSVESELNFEVCNNLSSKYLKASDKVGALISLDSLSQSVNEVETREADAIDQLQISGTMGQSTEKASDEDALRLLKWLASSQAAEDINSDDELAHETILSPLIPAKNIDKVLEKANVDYESESQKECQDILDSIDMLNFEEFSGGVSKPIDYNHYSEALTNKKIPQVDGSSDDPQSTPCSSKSLKSHTNEADTPLEVHLSPELNSRLIHKNLRKRPRWGSLPIFHQNANNVSLPNAFDILSDCDGEKKEGFGTTGGGNESENFPCFVKNDERKDVIYTKQASWITECSTRELMRRKRAHRVKLSKLRSPVEDRKVETCFNAEYGKGDIDIDTKLRINFQDTDSSCLPMHKPPTADEGTKFHETDIHSICSMCSEVSNVKPVKSCCPTLGNSTLCSSTSMVLGNMANNGNQESVQLDRGHSYRCENLNNSVNYDASLHVSSCTFEHPRSSKSDIIGENFGCRDLLQTDAGLCTASNLAASKSISRNECLSESGCQISMQKVPENSAEGLKDMSSETTLLQFENSQYYDSGSGFCLPYCSTSDYVKKEAERVKFIGMTFYNKPPMIPWTDEPENEAPVLPKNGSLNDGTTVQGRSMGGCLPFFTRNGPQEKELQAPKKYDYIVHQELVMGVPILYQNDGSFLYMLTPIISPPSRECVDRWLSFDGSHISRENMDTPSLFPQLPNGSSSVVRDSLGLQADVSYSPVLVSAPFSDANPNLDQLHQQHNQESCSMEAESPKETEKKPLAGQDFSQISGPNRKLKPTPLSQIGFQDPARVGGGQQLTLLSIEVLAESRGDLRPDPQFDAINVIVLVFQEDDESTFDVHVLLRCNYACVKKDLYAMSECKVLVFMEESQLFSHFTKLIHSIDPDVIMGWDVQSSSLGLLAERAAHLGLGLLNNISRTPSETNVASGDSEATVKDMVNEIFSESVAAEAVHLENMVIDDEWGRTHTSDVRVGGRIVLNIWRLMRNEVKLNMYTVEAVAKTVLRRTIPFIHWKVLTKWFSSGPGRARYRSIYYILERAKLNLQIMNQLDVISRTSELARVFGIDFFSVLSRGSQYRVESMFLRLAHTQNYLAISPGNQQVANQPAMECLPLVMEPESGFYSDPVIVLDFQSLYPSMVIAYNLCFCTCLGKIMPPKENCLGVSSYSPNINILQNLKHELLVTPNGVVYVSPKVQKGILPRLLEEILSTRIMVKQAMKKLAPSQLVLNRIFNARQLALKLIANVTYGYTAAGFSGRMPCAELADSIVQCGRKTLETAISFVNSNEKWKAKVVYGDTDSMFVLLKDRSLKEAFAIGREIASAITEMNPNPVVLKMEKVYYPCFLLTKKRYVGYSYETADQSKPMFDAKGIETVRRDTCEAVSKTMEQSLRIYFESQNIDEVKSYMLRQWARILSGRVSIQDFVFAKEVRLGTYSARASMLPPAAIVATKAMRADPRAEPRYAERIPYVVVHGEPGARLVDMVVDPLELLGLSSPFRLNDIYYIRKQIIPTLQRVFGLVGADLNQWFLDMPRRGREGVGKCNSLVTNPLRTRIDCYYISNHCILCGNVVQASALLCHNCLKNETTVAAALTGRSSKLEKDIQHLVAICRHCGGGDWHIESGVKCISLACPVFYERRKVQKELRSLSEVAAASGFYPKCMVEWF